MLADRLSAYRNTVQQDNTRFLQRIGVSLDCGRVIGEINVKLGLTEAVVLEMLRIFS